MTNEERLEVSSASCALHVFKATAKAVTLIALHL
jgi:hypothetical protein